MRRGPLEARARAYALEQIKQLRNYGVITVYVGVTDGDVLSQVGVLITDAFTMGFHAGTEHEQKGGRK